MGVSGFGRLPLTLARGGVECVQWYAKKVVSSGSVPVAFRLIEVAPLLQARETAWKPLASSAACLVAKGNVFPLGE